MTTPPGVFTNEPTTYGLVNYGENLYGVTAVPAQKQTVVAQWVIEPFIAQSMNYGAVGVSWTRPQGTPLRWRLLSNRYGYPVDQNDGNVLLDSADWIGSFYLDTSVIPGSYQYYGIYAQTATNTWVRCGVTACLTVEDSGTADWLADRLPAFLTEQLGGNLTQDDVGNPYLQQFLQVLAWGIDYVQSQYDALANHLNDPMAIPIGDLMNLATELGMPFDPMISVYLMRKAAANWAHVAQERGTVLGIENQLSLLTGFGVDLQTGPNLMLEQDQSYFPEPTYPAWDIHKSYKVGEIVTYASYVYQCLVAGPTSTGSGPTGTNTSNGYWQLVQDATEPSGLLTNPATGGINTWEVLYPAQTSNVGPSGSLVEGIGEPSPSALTVWQSNTLKLTNKEATAQDMMIRSVSRTAAQITSGAQLGPIINHNWDFETGTTYWTTFNSSTIGTTGLWANTGSASLVMTGNGTVANPQALSETLPVVPGAWYLVSGYANSPQGWSSGVTLGLNFYDNTGTWITALHTATTPLTANTPVFLAAWVQAPPNAVSGGIVFGVVNTPANTVQFLLDTCIWQAGSSAPDQAQAVNDGIPVPFTLPSQVWNSTVRYGTGAIVTYNGQPFIAQRASTGATPPFGGSATAEWAPLSPNSRLRLMVSAGISQNLTSGSNLTVPVTPFVSWYDQWGNFIARVTARTNQTAAPYGSGTAGLPYGVALDSFLLNPGVLATGRTFDATYNDQLSPPPAPVPTTATTGGTVAAGTYKVEISYVNAAGETLASASGSIVTTGTTSTITIPSPAASGSATGWYAYVTQVNGSTYTRQQAAGSPTAIGTGLTLIAPPTSSGNQPLTVATATDLGITWTAQDGSITVSGYNGGVAYPTVSSTRSVALAKCPANSQVGVTFVTLDTSLTQALFFRWSGETNYWKVTPTQLIKNVAGTKTTVATLTTAAQAGDRIVVEFSGPTILVFLNGALVANVSDAFNDTATLAGFGVE